MELKRKETLEAIKKLCLLDDNLMTLAFDGNIGRLMHDFRRLKAKDMFYPALAKQVNYFKETKGGQEIMCQIFEDLAKKRAEEARIEEKKAFARRLIARGKQTMEEIAEDADLPIEVVKELAGLQLA